MPGQAPSAHMLIWANVSQRPRASQPQAGQVWPVRERWPDPACSGSTFHDVWPDFDLPHPARLAHVPRVGGRPSVEARPPWPTMPHHAHDLPLVGQIGRSGHDGVDVRASASAPRGAGRGRRDPRPPRPLPQPAIKGRRGQDGTDGPIQPRGGRILATNGRTSRGRGRAPPPERSAGRNSTEL